MGHSPVVKMLLTPSLTTLSFSECRVTVYSVPGCRPSRMYWDWGAGILNCLGLEPSTVRNRRYAVMVALGTAQITTAVSSVTLMKVKPVGASGSEETRLAR